MEQSPDLEFIDQLVIPGMQIEPPHATKISGVNVGQAANVAGGEAQMGFAQAIEGIVQRHGQPDRIPQVMDSDSSHA